MSTLVERPPTQCRLGVHAGTQPQRARRESLTATDKAATIRPMTRETLQAILRGAPGVTEKAGTFKVESDHRASLYLGGEGRGIVANEVESVKLFDAYVCASSHDLGEVFCGYESVQAFGVKPPPGSGPKKTGF
jgi:hypothetical protein